MTLDLGQRYFSEIQAAWAPFSASHNIIPFCTPVFDSPDALVIGMNHSDFVPNGGDQSENISTNLTEQIPTENTFLVHNHKFAKGLRCVCERAGVELDETWLGTNRCAIQTGPAGISELEETLHYSKCLTKMDNILRRFVSEIKPRNVILVGKFAAELYYPDAVSVTFEQLAPRDEPLGNGKFFRLIPIKHVSRGSFWNMGADRLRNHFIKNA